MAYQWLEARWPNLFSALAQAETEEAIKQICESEIQAWRDERPGLKSEDSFRRPLTDTCNEIKVRLEGLQRQFALQYMSFSSEKWTELNDASRARLEKRLEQQKLLQEPDKIVAVATDLLKSDQWTEICVGLAVTTGRRLIELLQIGQFERKTDYSVLFLGQAKRGDDELPQYEIPTLCASSLVLDAFNRLRLLLDTTGLERREVSQRYGPAAREAAREHFSTLIPAREGKADIINHTFRTVYSRIAVFYYCPPRVADMHFMATVQGHYEKLQESEEQRRSYESNPYYQEYKIAALDGIQIDGRQGLHLGHKGVELLEVFKPKPQKEKAMATTPDTTEQKSTKGNNRPINVSKDFYPRFEAFKVRSGCKTNDETVGLLIDAYEEKETAQITATLTLEFLLGDELAIIARSTMKEGESIQDFLKRSVERLTNFQAGLKKRYSGTDFTKMSNAELMKQKDKEASFERVRRAIGAIALFNDNAEIDERRWFINVRVVQMVCGARFDNVSEYFKLHKADVDALNAAHQLTQKYNTKTYDIKSVEAITQAYENAPVAESEPVESTAEAE